MDGLLSHSEEPVERYDRLPDVFIESLSYSMLGRSRSLSAVFRLCQRRLATRGEGPLPPSESANERSRGWMIVTAGAVLAMTGVGVYQYKSLFHDYHPIPPIVLKPGSHSLHHLPATTGPVISPSTSTETVSRTQRESRKQPHSSAASKMPTEQPTTDHFSEDKPLPKQTKEPKKTDSIPAEIIDNTSIVELFSDALAGDSEEGSAASTEESISDADVQKLISGEITVQSLSAKLLASALKETVKAKPDWEEFKARHSQAAYDASMIKSAIEMERSDRKTSIGALEDKIQNDIMRIKELEGTISSLKEEAEKKLQETLEQAKNKHKHELKKLQERLKLEAAQKSMHDTALRIAEIDKLRESVNVLTTALKYWQDRTQSFTASQHLALEATLIDRWLETGTDGTRWMQTLRQNAVTDSFMETTLKCLPTDTIASKDQLMTQLFTLRRNIEYLSMLPPTGGGLLSQLAAKIGAQLKIRVPEMYADGNDISTKLDRVVEALDGGHVSDAVRQLQQLTQQTAAAQLCHTWIQEAEKYGTVQEMRRIMLARAQELAMSISTA